MTSELTGVEGVQLGIFLYHFFHSHLGKTRYIGNSVSGGATYLVRHTRSGIGVAGAPYEFPFSPKIYAQTIRVSFIRGERLYNLRF
jgi:hypothetical protein